LYVKNIMSFFLFEYINNMNIYLITAKKKCPLYSLNQIYFSENIIGFIYNIRHFFYSPEGSQRLCDKAKTTDKTVTLYPEAYHNLYIELDPIPQNALAEAFTWIQDRL